MARSLDAAVPKDKRPRHSKGDKRRMRGTSDQRITSALLILALYTSLLSLLYGLRWRNAYALALISYKLKHEQEDIVFEDTSLL